jgi:hypothetical protein
VTVLVILDFSKAFDCVSTFLYGRSMVVDGTRSSPRALFPGVL